MKEGAVEEEGESAGLVTVWIVARVFSFSSSAHPELEPQTDKQAGDIVYYVPT